jgi:tRNA modification GTPase
MQPAEKTIAAISTPLGEGGISVIRVSGESSIRSVASIFRGKEDLADAKSHSAHFGRILDKSGNIIDEVVCTVFRGPNSFTGEDTVEISCHGGMLVTRRVLESILEQGIHPAKPGEFTQRAFINGNLDLSQAEAIADLIQAQSEQAYKISLNQLEGELSKKLNYIRDRLVESVAIVELELDFVEDGIKLIDKQKLDSLLKEVMSDINGLISTYKYGKVLRDGVRVALVGAPNAGKSSILNVLLNEERSIVTDIPGTTRDFIEEKLTISGVLFRMVDTAGLRKTKDPIEREGVRRTWKLIDGSDILVLVHDATKKMNADELVFLREYKKNRHKRRLIILNNKIDLKRKTSKQDRAVTEFMVIPTSTIDHTGIEKFKNALAEDVLQDKVRENRESITITSERHYSALIRAKHGIKLSIESLESEESEEFIAVNLRQAIDSIGEIIGITTTEDILNTIFSRFCIGK